MGISILVDSNVEDNKKFPQKDKIKNQSLNVGVYLIYFSNMDEWSSVQKKNLQIYEGKKQLLHVRFIYFSNTDD